MRDTVSICPDHGVVIRGLTTTTDCPICGKPLVVEQEELTRDYEAPSMKSRGDERFLS